MILKRIITNLRTQNWTSLTLELIILVVGIFLGFQLEAWNQARLDKDLEAKYIERLKFEITVNIDAYGGQIENIEARLEVLVTSYDALEAGKNLPVEHEWFERTMCRAGMFGIPDNFNTVYNELIATGNLGLIENEKVRELYAIYIGRQATWGNAFSRMLITYEDNYQRLNPFRTVKPLSDDKRCAFDDIAFAKALNALPLLAKLQWEEAYLRRGMTATLRDLKALKEALEEAYPSVSANEGATP